MQASAKLSTLKCGFNSRCGHICPCGGTGIRTWLRTKVLRVRISPRILRRIGATGRRSSFKHCQLRVRLPYPAVHIVLNFDIHPCDGTWHTYLAKNQGFGSSNLPTGTRLAARSRSPTAEAADAKCEFESHREHSVKGTEQRMTQKERRCKKCQ